MKYISWTVAVAVALAMACGDDDGKNKDKPDDGDDQAEPSSPGTNPLSQLGAFSSLLSARSNEPGPYDEPRESPDFRKRRDHFVVFELSGAIVELESFTWYGASAGIELRALTERLRELGDDDKIQGMVLRLGGLDISMATAEELRDALVAFKAGGRTLACHVEDAANVSYFLLTACDRVGLAPTGNIVLSGAAAMPIHVKGLLDRVGVTADFLHVGAFKGAAEPLTRDAPSREMIETLEAMLDAQFDALVAAVATARKLDEARVRKLIDTALFTDEAALDAKLVDDVATFEAFRDEVAGEGGWRVVRLDGAEADLSTMMRFLGMSPPSRPSGPHVAVVYAVGNVVDGKGEGILGARAEIASRTLAAALRALARDDSVKAVVLRISSPGGSALASELILRAAEEVRARKPLVVSMADVAASGGYYIACRANKIFAQPNTLTGSIGVVGGKLVIGGALNNVGVTVHPLGRGKRAMMWSMVEPWTLEERRAVQKMMETTYKAFVTHVADGRGKSYDEIHAVAQGRVWTGRDALAHGLVDELGGLDAAVAEARRLAEVDDDTELEIYPPDPTLMDIVGSFGNASMPYGLDSAVATVARELGPREARAVDGLFRQVLLMRDSPVLAAMLLPVVFR